MAKTLRQYLEEKCSDEKLVVVLESVMAGVLKISSAVRLSDGEKAGSENVYGEEQLALDVQANNLLIEELKKNLEIGLLASEELDDEMKIGAGEFAVCFDPLDGSSLVDVNLSVGTIVGVYKAETFIGVKGDDQLASLIVVYGPRTTLILTIRDGIHEFVLRNGEFVLQRADLKIDEGKMFAPGNLRACAFREDYLELVNGWCREQYTLRYSGGMVPDVNQILLKGKGIFSYPGYQEAPDGKLRLLYECAPMALLVEQAGGAASDGQLRIMEKPLGAIDQRTPIFIGSKKEVEKCKVLLGRNV